MFSTFYIQLLATSPLYYLLLLKLKIHTLFHTVFIFYFLIDFPSENCLYFKSTTNTYVCTVYRAVKYIQSGEEATIETKTLYKVYYKPNL